MRSNKPYDIAVAAIEDVDEELVSALYFASEEANRGSPVNQATSAKLVMTEWDNELMSLTVAVVVAERLFKACLFLSRPPSLAAQFDSNSACPTYWCIKWAFCDELM